MDVFFSVQYSDEAHFRKEVLARITLRDLFNHVLGHSYGFDSCRRDLAIENSQITTSEIPETLSMSKGTVNIILLQRMTGN